MKARLKLLGSIVIAAAVAVSAQQGVAPSGAPARKAVTVDALDRLELQVAYDQVVKAQQQVTIAQQAFDKRFGEVQRKYKVGADWGYNTATGQFEAPVLPHRPEGSKP